LARQVGCWSQPGFGVTATALVSPCNLYKSKFCHAHQIGPPLMIERRGNVRLPGFRSIKPEGEEFWAVVWPSRSIMSARVLCTFDFRPEVSFLLKKVFKGTALTFHIDGKFARLTVLFLITLFSKPSYPVRTAFVALLIATYCHNIVGQSPLVVKWKSETPLNVMGEGLWFAKVAIDPETNIIRVVQTYNPGPITVSKLSLSGGMIFEKTWFKPGTGDRKLTPQIFSMDHDGNVILVIDEKNYSSGEEGLHYVSYSPNGTLLWEIAETVTGHDPFFQAAAVDNQNNTIFAGSISGQFVAQKMSPTGELIWRNAVQQPEGYSSATDVAVDAAGQSYVVGVGRTTTGGEVPLFRRFGPGGEASDFWTDPRANSGLGNVRVAQSGAIYVTDSYLLFRIDANGQTEWVRSTDGGLPHIAALMGDDKIALIGPNGFTIWDKTGKPLGAGGFSGPYYEQKVLSRGESLFISRGPRFSELRADGSLASEINLEGTTLRDMAVGGNSDVAFVEGITRLDGSNAIITGVLPHSGLADRPRIVEQPRGAVLLAGNDFAPSVGASGSNLRYQWFYGVFPFTQSAMEGQTNSSLVLTNVQVVQSGKYFVTVSNEFGRVSSAYAELAVHLVPKITANPTTTPSRPYAGERVIWKYSASITQPAGTQWYKDGTPISGATNLTYIIPASGPADFGKYSVLITNLFGQAMSEEVEFPEFLQNVEITVLTNELSFTQGTLGKDAQNNVYLGGAVLRTNKYTAVAAKFHPSGELIWTQNLPDLEPVVVPAPTIACSVGKDGTMYIPGKTNSTPVLCKLDLDGSVAWIANLKSELNTITRVRVGDRYSYVAGVLLTANKRALVVVALDSSGARAWTTSIDAGLASDLFSWLEVTPDEQIFLASRAAKALYAISSSGNVLWTNSLSTNSLVDMKAGPGNSVYLATQNGRLGACTKYSGSGEKLWSTLLRRPSQLNTETTQLEVDRFGNAYVASSLASAVAKIDTDGKLLCEWSAVTQFPYRHLQTTESNGVYMLIYPLGSFSLSKFDALGVRRWSRNLPSQDGNVPFIPVTDREVFILAPRRLFKVRDLETPEMEKITAKIEQSMGATNILLQVKVEGAAAEKVTWYPNGSPGGIPSVAFGETIVPRFSVSGLSYSAEIETEEAVIATADYFFGAFSLISDVHSTDQNLHFTLRGLSNYGFRIQRSRNLIDWEDYDSGTLNSNGLSQITIPINTIQHEEQKEYFRGIR